MKRISLRSLLLARYGRRLFFHGLALLALMPVAALAVVLEGTGHAVIQGGNLELAREEARRAALRDVALQYEARIDSRDTVTNGVVTESELVVATSAQARSIEILSERQVGNLMRVTLRADMSQSASCEVGTAARLKKRVAVAGFPLLAPEQAVLGGIDDAGETLPQQLRARLQQTGRLEVLSASTTQLMLDTVNAPTAQAFDNRLSNVSALARDLDAQFVVAGVIRSVAVEDPQAWGSSVLDRLQRGLGVVNRHRRFVADLMVFDGFSGAPVYQSRYATRGLWDAAPASSAGFDSEGFHRTGYGEAVTGVLDDMATAIAAAVRCQPFITRVTRVEGRRVTLASGSTAGLRPGDELHLYRSYSYFDTPGAAPELKDSQASVTINSVHPDFSNGEMPMTGALVNIQRGDQAVVW
ncbi:flagellar assembly protein T N-terminal domain-containing protein [Marinobacter sp. SS21]|uniref:flagellar assembly protein T N-terminal domain-containing protein n=1 Tax=Marinobacter sp. SS21 TaxID=2979460 RepID=UPI00232E94AA|nr:flagellar assembly protein T N-terminal domain-containing protein [Marinobacter sp. SS21]MDC0663707.1 flagellar assembly protein T N-terminal domain-containing protein [Marinobacter sp. SS21]